MKIQNISDIKSVIELGNWKIFGIGGLPETRSEAYYVVNDFELICSRGTGELMSVRKLFKVNIFDIENNSKNGAHIISDKKVVSYINSFSDEKKIAVYLLKSSPEVEDLCRKNGWTLMAEESDLFNKLESRSFFFDLLKRIGYTRDFEIIELREFDNNLDELFERFGDKIVIQTFCGTGGKGTFIVQRADCEDFFEKTNLERNEKVVVTSFVKGFDIAVTGCVTRNNGILSGPARYQFVGVDAVVSGKDFSENSFCGNDWSVIEEYRDNVQNQARGFVEKMGKILKEEGFRGIFGVDFIYNKDSKKLVPLEINPRTLGSFPVETQFEVLNQKIPLIGFHILEFLESNYEIVKDFNVERENDLKKECSHVMLVNFLKKDLRFGKDLKSGVYHINGLELEFVRDGFQVSDIQNIEREFVLTAGVPTSDYEYKKNSQLFRIIWSRSIQINNVQAIDSRAKQEIGIVKNEIKRMVSDLKK